MCARARVCLIESDLETSTMRPDLGFCTKKKNWEYILLVTKLGGRAICNQQCCQLEVRHEILY